MAVFDFDGHEELDPLVVLGLVARHEGWLLGRRINRSLRLRRLLWLSRAVQVRCTLHAGVGPGLSTLLHLQVLGWAASLCCHFA